MKTDSRKCINIRKIVEYLGTVIAFMELQGMTQILLYMLLGKLKFLKCLNEKKKLRLLNTIVALCKVWEAAVKDVKKFIQTVCCSGKEEKSITETRVWL